MATNQMENLKEMATAPFGAGQEMTKSQYIQNMTALEKTEKEPEKTDANIDSEAQVVAHRPHRMVFHDFDYLNPLTMRPQGMGETQKPRGGNLGSMPKMGVISENPYRDVIPRPGGKLKKLSPGKSQRSGNPVYLRSR